MKIDVGEQFGRTRLDKFLSASLEDRTRAFLQKLIKDGHVSINGTVTGKPGKVLNVGDVVEVNIPEPKEIKAEAEDIDLEILHEDADIVVVDKPAGMVVHPSETGSHMTGTLVNAILYHCSNELTGISGELRPGIVHRLDKNTSGVLVVAKTDLAQQSLMKQFKDRKVGKRYVALVNGVVDPPEASINSPIGRSLHNRKKMAVVHEGKGREAVTEYKVRETFSDSFGEYSLIDIDLKTGRTHQIRVHMNAIKSPVVGDITYGDSRVNKHFLNEYGLDRQFLHAAELRIKHPKTEKEMVFKSELAKDLEGVVERFL
jgi:23S rRNA pseudouridine1911/1915/1917 synthase